MAPTTPRALSWRALIGALIRGETLSPDEAAWAMNEIMEGAATPVQVAGFGVALRMKGETPGELAGPGRGDAAQGHPRSACPETSSTWSARAGTARTR